MKKLKKKKKIFTYATYLSSTYSAKSLGTRRRTKPITLYPYGGRPGRGMVGRYKPDKQNAMCPMVPITKGKARRGIECEEEVNF